MRSADHGLVVAVLVVSAAFSLAFDVGAQAPSQITGTIRDASAAPIAGATVTLTRAARDTSQFMIDGTATVLT